MGWFVSYLGYREKVSRQVSEIGEVSGLVCVLPWLEKVSRQVSGIGEVSGLVYVFPWLQRESEQTGEWDWGGEWASLCLTLVTERK